MDEADPPPGESLPTVHVSVRVVSGAIRHVPSTGMASATTSRRSARVGRTLKSAALGGTESFGVLSPAAAIATSFILGRRLIGALRVPTSETWAHSESASAHATAI